MRREIEALAARIDDIAPTEIAELIKALDAEALSDVERWAGDALKETPVPIARAGGDRWARRRRALRWLAAETAAQRGKPDELLDLLYASWRDEGANVARLVETLVDAGRVDEAAVVARMALASDGCSERDRIAAALEAIAAPPSGWREALLAFAADPSVGAWRHLRRFTPDERDYFRTRNAIDFLSGIGVDGGVLFACATDDGITPDAIALCERGLVDPEVVAQRGRDGAARARGLWLGLAARAAFARGDALGVVRLLRAAFACADPEFPPIGDAMAIRAAADDSLNEMLDRAGIPTR